jgi:hypothetical protein
VTTNADARLYASAIAIVSGIYSMAAATLASELIMIRGRAM